MNNPKVFDYLWKHFSFTKNTGSMFYHQDVARVQVFADIQNSALRAQHPQNQGWVCISLTLQQKQWEEWSLACLQNRPCKHVLLLCFLMSWSVMRIHLF